MSSIGEAAQDHVNLADALNSQVVEALKLTEKRHDEAKKRQVQYFQKLLSERDKLYNERLKVCSRCRLCLMILADCICLRQSKRW